MSSRLNRSFPAAAGLGPAPRRPGRAAWAPSRPSHLKLRGPKHWQLPHRHSAAIWTQTRRTRTRPVTAATGWPLALLPLPVHCQWHSGAGTAIRQLRCWRWACQCSGPQPGKGRQEPEGGPGPALAPARGRVPEPAGDGLVAGARRPGPRLRPGPGPAGSTPIPKGAGKRPGRPKAAGGLFEGGSRRAARRAPPGPGFRHCQPAWQRHQKLRADAPRKSRRSACYRASGPRPEIVPRRMLHAQHRRRPPGVTWL